MSSRIARFAVVGAALALPLSAMIAAPATAAPTTTTRPIVTSAVPKANVRTGPSPWRGAPFRHPERQRLLPWSCAGPTSSAPWYGRAEDPRRSTYRASWRRSSRSPAATPTPSTCGTNARRGTLPWACCRVIAPTYQAHAKPGYRSLRYQAVPYTNIWAALNYVRHTYGMGKFARWNQGQNWAY